MLDLPRISVPMSLLSVATAAVVAAALHCTVATAITTFASVPPHFFSFIARSYTDYLGRSLKFARLPELNARRNRDTRSPSTCRSEAVLAFFQGYAVEIETSRND